jgi:hypothetical protein
MLGARFHWIVLSAVIAATAPMVGGCVVEAESPEAYNGYEVQYYNGRVVYYETDGRPYYYHNNSVYYVPQTHPHYNTLRTHYYRERPRYHNWYSRRGYRYKTYYRR